MRTNPTSFVLDELHVIGDVVVAALAEQTVMGNGSLFRPMFGQLFRPIFKSSSFLFFQGSKRPVVILVYRAGIMSAFEVDGSSIDLDDLDRRYPDHRSNFERLAMNRI